LEIDNRTVCLKLFSLRFFLSLHLENSINACLKHCSIVCSYFALYLGSKIKFTKIVYTHSEHSVNLHNPRKPHLFFYLQFFGSFCVPCGRWHVAGGASSFAILCKFMSMPQHMKWRWWWLWWWWQHVCV